MTAQPTPSHHRAAVIGAGNMGTLIAAVLGQVMPVVVVSREEPRAAQLFRHGARTEGLIEAASRPVIVKDIAAVKDAGGASLIFVATKTTAIAGVATDLKPELKAISPDDTPPLVISFQNGIDPGRELMERLDHRRILRMVLSLGGTLTPDGRAVNITLNQPPHAIGALDTDLFPEATRVAELLTEGGLETERSDDIEAAVWKKGLVNAAMNPVAALVNATIGEVLDAPSAAIVDQLLAEGIAVANAEGIDLPTDYHERATNMLSHAREHLPSMVEDIRSNRASEIGQLNRQIMEHARRLNIKTPTHDTIDALIETFDWKVYHTNPDSL